MLKIKTIMEVVAMSELYDVCVKAGLEKELDECEYSLTDLLFEDVSYACGEYRLLNLYNSLYEDELEISLREDPKDKDNITYLRCMVAIQKALKDAGIQNHILVEIGV